MSVEAFVSSNRTREFQQVFQYVPSLRALYTDTEIYFRAKGFVDFAAATWPVVPVAICAVYIAALAIIPRVMQDRPAYGLKTELAAWNLFLSVFSLFGALRTVPHLALRLYTSSFRETVCEDAEISYGEGACGMWVMLFVYSKVLELVDTAFLVLRKRRVLFLHWYHHVSVLLFCWHSYATESSSGLYFVAMNYSVHAVMYGYYFLSALRMWPRALPAQIITVAQITQMIVGVVVCSSTLVYYALGNEDCSVQRENVVAGIVMYGSYLYLFTDFFVRRFFLKAKSH